MASLTSVEGTSWMDHEFFSSGLDKSEVGWDWLSLQLADNTELMLYRLRHKDGSVDPFSSGTYVDANGKSTFLGVRDFSMTPTGETYTSPITKAVYPIAWRVTIPSLATAICTSRRLLHRRSWRVAAAPALSYWEGAIDISGTRGAHSDRGSWLSGDDRLCGGVKDGNCAVDCLRER